MFFETHCSEGQHSKNDEQFGADKEEKGVEPLFVSSTAEPSWVSCCSLTVIMNLESALLNLMRMVPVPNLRKLYF